MARLYTNENFPLPVAEELRRLGHDVVTVQEAGKALQAVPDEEVLSFAQTQGRVLVTLNRKHFLRLHRQIPEHAGMVVCTFDPDFTGQAMRIHTGLQEQPSLAGKVIRINRPGPSSPPIP